MSKKHLLNIRTMLVYGLELQTLYPSIGDDYKTLNCKQIAKKYHLSKHFGVKLKTAMSIVLRALRGYDGAFKHLRIKPYPGLLKPKTFQRLVKEHSKTARFKSGKKQCKNKKGIHGQTSTERKQSIYKALKARGIQPKEITLFSEKERMFILALCKKEKYWAGTKVRLQTITDMVNQTFHKQKYQSGICVRDNRAIGSLIQRLKKHEELQRS